MFLFFNLCRNAVVETITVITLSPLRQLREDNSSFSASVSGIPNPVGPRVTLSYPILSRMLESTKSRWQQARRTPQDASLIPNVLLFFFPCISSPSLSILFYYIICTPSAISNPFMESKKAFSHRQWDSGDIYAF